MFLKWLKRAGYLLLALFVLLNVMVASHAHYLTHFFANVPRSPRIEDMSWSAKTKAMLLGMPLPKSKVVDSFQVPHRTVSITTDDGLVLESWIAPAALSVSKGTILLFHGHGSNKSGIIREATAFHAMGWQVVLTDFRAHGNSSGEACTIGANESLDVKAVYDYARKELKEKNLLIWGISLGAATTLHAIANYPVRPERLMLEMPFASLHDAVRGRVRMMQLPAEPLATLLTFWGGIQHGFWAFGFQPVQDASAVSCPVLLQWGFNDKRVTENETNNLFAQLGTNKRTMMKYYQSGHESLLKKEPQKWQAVVQEFLR
jgi:alpha-beta hydrolase superfamily lysophospholipase